MIWLRNIITRLCVYVFSYEVERPLKIYCDNLFAVMYSNNNRSSSKSKHIDIEFLVVNERIQSKIVSIKHIGTNSMLADPLTKGMTPKVFQEYTAHMGVVIIDNMQF